MIIKSLDQDENIVCPSYVERPLRGEWLDEVYQLLLGQSHARTHFSLTVPGRSCDIINNPTPQPTQSVLHLDSSMAATEYHRHINIIRHSCIYRS